MIFHCCLCFQIKIIILHKRYFLNKYLGGSILLVGAKAPIDPTNVGYIAPGDPGAPGIKIWTPRAPLGIKI